MHSSISILIIILIIIQTVTAFNNHSKTTIEFLDIL